MATEAGTPALRKLWGQAARQLTARPVEQIVRQLDLHDRLVEADPTLGVFRGQVRL